MLYKISIFIAIGYMPIHLIYTEKHTEEESSQVCLPKFILL